MFSQKNMCSKMFQLGFIRVEYIVTFSVAGWSVLWSPVAVCVAPAILLGILAKFSVIQQEKVVALLRFLIDFMTSVADLFIRFNYYLR